MELSKGEMELSKQEMELFLLCPIFLSKNFFDKSCFMRSKDSKKDFRNRKWNYLNSKWNYFFKDFRNRKWNYLNR